MTPEELRVEIVNGIDGLSRLPFLSDAKKRLLAAERAFWMADDAPLAKLLTFYNTKE